MTILNIPNLVAYAARHNGPLTVNYYSLEPGSLAELVAFAGRQNVLASGSEGVEFTGTVPNFGDWCITVIL